MSKQAPVVGWEPTNPRTSQGPELHQDRALRTRALVLNCAAEIFADKGYRGTSIQDVAAKAGMTKGAVYFHFPSKDILTVAVVEEHYTRWPVMLESVRARKLSPLDTVVALLDLVAEAFHTDVVVRGGARLQIEHALIGLPLPTPYVGWINLLTQLLEEADEAGQLRAGVTPAAAARAIVGAFFGMQHVSETVSQRADLPARWSEMRELLFYSIRA
ncbi:ScbR family autoregulator-binding transcription factor [Kitasatospora sp. NPDC057223]|uniref:ScbR family autoregulator-binding transcription factor n=1 Tax=Kitasatospora sp. NPDC057223 TaxID=3346055 RepID=UPI0036394D82